MRNGGGPIIESQLSELRNMRVMLEQARLLARDLAYHRKVRLEATRSCLWDFPDSLSTHSGEQGHKEGPGTL